jgi:hypothetical protein
MVSRYSQSTLLKSIYIRGGNERIARVTVPDTAQSIEEYEANARLIAAAPDLLEALQHLMVAHGEQLDYAFQQAQDAIAKATGEQA